MAAATLSTRKLSESLRQKLLKQAIAICDGTDEKKKEELLWRMSGTLLPRLNEHTGEGGEKLFPAPLLNGKSNDSSNHSNKKTTRAEKKD